MSGGGYPMPSGLPHAIAGTRGVCGAQRKDEDAPCENPRGECSNHCGSKRRDGGVCSQRPMPNGRCKMHGGLSPIGAGSPAFKHGRNSRYSRVLTGTNLKRYEDALDDPAHVELRADLALIETMLFDALERAQVGQLGPLWDELDGQWRRFRVAQRNGESGAAARALGRVGEIVDQGAESWRATQEVTNLIERKRRVTESERRRLLDENQMISAARALAFAGTVVAVVRRHVHDRETLAAISSDLARLVHQDL